MEYMKQGTTYRQLSYEERIEISILNKQGKSIRYIARSINRSPNTVSRELREKLVRNEYIPKKAHHKTYYRRYLSKRDSMKVVKLKELSYLVHDKLPLGWSPERIAGYATLLGYKISKKAVYKYIKNRNLKRHLFWKRNRKKGGLKRGVKLPTDYEKRLINERPIITSSGHWELDFIVSRQSGSVLLVMTDKWTRYSIIVYLPQKTHKLVLDSLVDIQKKYLIKSITTDNDIVFRKWKDMENKLIIPFFFCLPHHSWEKGLVENTNRWIRCFIPKKKDIAEVSKEDIIKATAYLNEIPRQCLGYRTATELLFKNRVS